jgi:hypothetical protein
MGAAMSRYATPVTDQLQWIEVSLEQPCRVCGAVSECTILEEGEYARCVQTVSERPVLDRGWLHCLAEPSLDAHVLSSLA